jgi:hypothetical protein
MARDITDAPLTTDELPDNVAEDPADRPLSPNDPRADDREDEENAKEPAEQEPDAATKAAMSLANQALDAAIRGQAKESTEFWYRIFSELGAPGMLTGLVVVCDALLKARAGVAVDGPPLADGDDVVDEALAARQAWVGRMISARAAHDELGVLAAFDDLPDEDPYVTGDYIMELTNIAAAAIRASREPAQPAH